MLKELCDVCETALEAQWSSSDDSSGGGGGGQQFNKGGEKLREAFCSVAWAERMERQEELVKKYQVRAEHFSCVAPVVKSSAVTADSSAAFGRADLLFSYVSYVPTSPPLPPVHSGGLPSQSHGQLHGLVPHEPPAVAPAASAAVL